MKDDAGTNGTSEVAQVLLTLCTEALSVETVRLEDNFFELGGDSLSAMWLLSGIQDHFKTEIPLALLFDAQTMGDVIAVIEKHLADGSPIAELSE